MSYQRHRRLAFVEMMKAMIHLFTNAWAFEALLRITCFRFACSYSTFCHPCIDQHHDHLVVLNVLIQGTYAHPNPCGFGKRLWSFVVTVQAIEPLHTKIILLGSSESLMSCGYSSIAPAIIACPRCRKHLRLRRMKCDAWVARCRWALPIQSAHMVSTCIYSSLCD